MLLFCGEKNEWTREASEGIRRKEEAGVIPISFANPKAPPHAERTVRRFFLFFSFNDLMNSVILAPTKILLLLSPTFYLEI
jgi:hypothetical protein